jgi:nucleotide-binding universal stress UspA family protein
MKIVVGYTKTAEGEAALERAIDEACLRDAELVVVHSSRGNEPAEEVLRYREELEGIDSRLVEAGVSHSIHDLALGHGPGQDIVEIASQLGAGMIVIGLRRRSPVGKMFLGSNAQEILIDSDCPVLTVKAGK